MTLTGEQILAVLALILGPSSLVGVMVKRWSDDRAIGRAAEALREAEVNKALAEAWARLVDTAEKRESAANERNDRAITSISGLTSALTDLTNTNRLVLEEIKRANTISDREQRTRP